MRLVAVLALWLSLALAPVEGAALANCDMPPPTLDDWPVALPETEGLDPQLICAIGPRLEKLRDASPNGVVVVRHGTLVYEHYFVGGMEYGPDTSHEMKSITKSVVALLVGIAVDRSWLPSLDAPVFSFFPEYADLRTPGKSTISVRDLLTMTSGLDWPEFALSYTDPLNVEHRMAMAADPYRFVLEQPLAAPPGRLWNYNSGGVELLGAILKKVSGETLDRLAAETLFGPLGIKDTDQVWADLKNGAPAASWGLWLRPRDLAKIGQLVLDHGVWRGRRIVSAAWIDEMTASQIPTGLWRWGGYGYGYLWWLTRLATRDRDFNVLEGVGWGGQRLYVVPALDLVVAVTAGDYTYPASHYLAGYAALDSALRATAH